MKKDSRSVKKKVIKVKVKSESALQRWLEVFVSPQVLSTEKMTPLHSKSNQSTSTNIVPTEEKFNSSRCSFGFHPFSPIPLGGT
ncbi:uncharacterized protein DS421_18g615320 [Arachis hypogaea]|nr:uncharacterized protein DS421_18g615320 [Arachis hypogaea]